MAVLPSEYNKKILNTKARRSQIIMSGKHQYIYQNNSKFSSKMEIIQSSMSYQSAISHISIKKFHSSTVIWDCLMYQISFKV
jgi:hypothetical protein